MRRSALSGSITETAANRWCSSRCHIRRGSAAKLTVSRAIRGPRARNFSFHRAASDLPASPGVALGGLGREYSRPGRRAVEIVYPPYWPALQDACCFERSWAEPTTCMDARAFRGSSLRPRAARASHLTVPCHDSVVPAVRPTTDTQMREADKSIFALTTRTRPTSRVDRTNGANPALKRRAISALSRNSDPTIRQALQEIVER